MSKVVHQDAAESADHLAWAARLFLQKGSPAALAELTVAVAAYEDRCAREGYEPRPASQRQGKSDVGT